MFLKKNVLILGAGFVSRPGVDYLLKRGLNLTIVDIDIDRAKKLVKDYSNGNAVSFDINDTDKLEEFIRNNDIIVSLLPWTLHIKVAKLCLKNNRDMATTSYVSDEMNKLNEEVKNKSLLFLNELGVDPGLDHMSAKKIIDEVQGAGGKVEHFYSYCGGLPAPDDNDNPFGYKFSWSPRGVVLASKNSARFLESGKVIEVEGKELFSNKTVLSETVEGIGELDVYPNRDSIPYIEIYGLEEAKTVKRGTYRYKGWCETFYNIVKLGLVDEGIKEGLKGNSFYTVICDLVGCNKDDNLKIKLANKLNIKEDGEIINRFDWLGLFNKDRLLNNNNHLDNLSELLQEKLFYKDGEKDMLVLKHRFIVSDKDDIKEEITSTLIDYGIPNGDTSMARTVSLPLAIGVSLMAEGKISLKGVKRPVYKEIYEPVLRELEKLGIEMVENRKEL